MSARDLEIFPVTEKGMDLDDVATKAAFASKKYIFKENVQDMSKCQRRLKMYADTSASISMYLVTILTLNIRFLSCKKGYRIV